MTIVAKLSILDVCGGTGYTFTNSAIWAKCTRKKKQHTKCATEEECKTKTSQHEKVKLGIVGYMKRVQHKKNSKWKLCNICNMEKIQHEKNAAMKCNMQHKKCKMKRLQHKKKCNMKKVQHRNSATWTKWNIKKCHAKKLQKQRTRGVPKKNRCSENMQQIYRRKLMPKCDFKKVAFQLYWNHTSAWVFFCNFPAYFQNTLS